MNTRQLLTALIVIAMSCSLQAQNLTGKEIIQKAKDRPNGESRYAKVEMTLIKKSGHKRVRRMESWAMDVGKDTKTIMFFTYPGDVKGTGFLTWDYDDPSKTDDKWLYLPAMKKTRRISGKSSKTDYFMGSDFTYNDMSPRSVDEEEHKLLKEEKIDGNNCWVIESRPKDKDEIYSRRVIWIRQDCLIPIKAEYYDKLNKLHRRMTCSDIKKIQGFWTMESMQMENVQTEHKTIIKMSNQKFDLKVSTGMFTVANLEKGL